LGGGRYEYNLKAETYCRRTFYGNLCEENKNYTMELCGRIILYNYEHTSVEVFSDAPAWIGTMPVENEDSSRSEG
jgi:hypothetical protein